MTINAKKSLLGPGRLQNETLDKIENLLIHHQQDNTVRGLYSADQLSKIRAHLSKLADWLTDHPPAFLQQTDRSAPACRFDETTVLCIAYIDHIISDTNLKPAAVLSRFFNKHLQDKYSHLHILPFFPSPVIHESLQGPAKRADGGFEAMNYKLDPIYGRPEDILETKAGLMFDFVLNHLSTKGKLFQNFLEDVPGYEDFFVTVPEDKLSQLDLTPVFRPRAHHPIVPYTNSKGQVKYVWCTFSETQADLNIKNPDVFCLLMEALVKDFIGQGASWVRLDAIGYLIKMLGVEKQEALTDCFGIEETHNVLKAMRLFLSDIAPPVTLVPEVNATEDVIKTYYGAHHDEGHLVYEFPSAPLSLYTIYREDAGAILDWAKLRNEDPEQIGLAFTNSHDGIGLLPMADVPPLPDQTNAGDFLIEQIKQRGGAINYKSKIINGQTAQLPYEACITWLQAILTPAEFSALHKDALSTDEIKLIVNRFMASQSFIYTAPHCVPADYLGVTTGLLNDEPLAKASQHPRDKNRGLIKAEDFEKSLRQPQSNYEQLRHDIFFRKQAMIKSRKTSAAFNPYALCAVDVIKTENQDPHSVPVYSILRRAANDQESVLALTNCTAIPQKIQMKAPELQQVKSGFDLISGENMHMSDITLSPYQVCWIRF
ncbi:MAG: alpha-amylase family glycosyl hydrolase [Pseudomonadota bacterium]